MPMEIWKTLHVDDSFVPPSRIQFLAGPSTNFITTYLWLSYLLASKVKVDEVGPRFQ
jgi:hypothetical protein